MKKTIKPTSGLMSQAVLNKQPQVKVPAQNIWQRRAFRIGKYELVLKNEPLLEFLSGQKIYYLPFAPDMCAGLINLRGNLVPVFDWQKVFGVADEALDLTKILVLGDGQELIAFVISEILDEITISDEVVQHQFDSQSLPVKLRGKLDEIIQYEDALYFQFDHEKFFNR